MGQDVSITQKIWHWLSDYPHGRRGTRCLSVAVGVMLTFRAFTELPFAEYLYGGTDGLGTGNIAAIFGLRIADVCSKCFTIHGMPYVMMLLQAIFGLALIFRYQVRIAMLGAFVVFSLINNRLQQVGDGGDNITQLILIYMLFMLPPTAKPQPNSLSVWMHNIGLLAIGFQVCDLYFTAGTAKMAGDKWFHGVAMYYISQVDWFSVPWMRGIFRDPFVATLSTYVPMFYQVFFPLAIFSRLKIPWLITGILFHIGIAIFMGLITFSTVMIGLELFLITDDEYAWIDIKIAEWWQGRLLRFRSQRADCNTYAPDRKQEILDDYQERVFLRAMKCVFEVSPSMVMAWLKKKC